TRAPSRPRILHPRRPPCVVSPAGVVARPGPPSHLDNAPFARALSLRKRGVGAGGVHRSPGIIPSMNPLLDALHPYPFERWRALARDVTPSPAHRPISLGIGE